MLCVEGISKQPEKIKQLKEWLIVENYVPHQALHDLRLDLKTDKKTGKEYIEIYPLSKLENLQLLGVHKIVYLPAGKLTTENLAEHVIPEVKAKAIEDLHNKYMSRGPRF